MKKINRTKNINESNVIGACIVNNIKDELEFMGFDVTVSKRNSPYRASISATYISNEKTLFSKNKSITIPVGDIFYDLSYHDEMVVICHDKRFTDIVEKVVDVYKDHIDRYIYWGDC